MNRIIHCAASLGSTPVNFDDIVRTHWQPVFRFVMISVRDRHLAEDLTQDCFSKAYDGWHRFRHDCTVNTWLRRIAANVIHDFSSDKRCQFWRRLASVDVARAGEWLAAAEPSPEANVMLEDRLRLIWRAALLVTPKQQMAFAMRFSRDMEIHEIASAMGITEGAAKVHLFRAVRTVRRRLAAKAL